MFYAGDLIHDKYSDIILEKDKTKTYCIAVYIGGNVWRIARKRKKIAVGGYKFGGTIATPSPIVYVVGRNIG